MEINISINDYPSYMELFLRKKNTGEAEKQSPAEMPAMEFKTLTISELLQEYVLTSRSIFNTVCNCVNDTSWLFGTNRYIYSDHESSVPYFSLLTDENVSSRIIQAFVIDDPNYCYNNARCVFDVYNKDLYGDIDPFWYSDLSSSRCYDFFTLVNEVFINYDRQWYWSESDALCFIRDLKPTAKTKDLSNIGIVLYLGCSGVVRINYFAQYKDSIYERYYPETFNITYYDWSNKDKFKKNLKFYKNITSNKNDIINKFQCYVDTVSKDVSVPSTDMDSIGRITVKAKVRYDKVSFLFFAAEASDVVNMEECFDQLVFPDFNEFISCFYSLFRVRGDLIRYFCTRSLELQTQRLLQNDNLGTFETFINNNNTIHISDFDKIDLSDNEDEDDNDEDNHNGTEDSF